MGADHRVGRDNPADAERVAGDFGRGSSSAVETVRSRVRRIVSFRGYGIPKNEQEDLVQEVMVQLWRTATRESNAAGPRFWGLVEVVAARRCIDWLRTSRSSVPLEESMAEKRPGPLAKTLDRERLALASQALAELDEPCQRLIYLQAGLDLPYREIARILGKSEGALRVQMYRCVRQARRILASLSGASERRTVVRRNEE